MAKDREIAKDLLGETIATAYAGFDKLKSKTAFLSFLFTIASRLFYRKINNVKKDINRNQNLDELFSTDLSPDDMADISILYENLNKLPHDQKEAIILFHIEGFSRKEVAVIQKVSEETVKSRLAYGKKQLSVLMGADYE